jgi:hypothetical protein
VQFEETFASGSALAHATTDSDANALVKAIATDFMTSEGRSAARDGLKEKFADGKAAEIKTKSVDSLRLRSARMTFANKGRKVWAERPANQS